MHTATALRSQFPPAGSPWRTGVVTSLLVHGFALASFLAVPFHDVVPHPEIIQLSVMQGAPPVPAVQTSNDAPAAMKAAPVVRQRERIRIPTEEPVRAARDPETAPVVPEVHTTPVSTVAAHDVTLPISVPHSSGGTGGGNIPGERGGAVTATSAASGTGTGAGEGNAPLMTVTFGDAAGPSFVYRHMPVYPLVAKRFGKEGTVVLNLLIDARGKLQDVAVVTPGTFGFTEAAVEAVRKSTFAPAQRGGERVPSRAILSVRFRLE